MIEILPGQLDTTLFYSVSVSLILSFFQKHPTTPTGYLLHYISIKSSTLLLRGNEIFIGLLTIPVVISAILVVFISLMIHGVHKFKRRLLEIYIIFKIVIFALFTLLELVSIIMYLMYYHGGIQIMSDVSVFLNSFFYFYQGKLSL